MKLWLVLCCMAFLPDVEGGVVLWPRMPESNPVRVPLLTEKIPDADRLKAPVAFEPEAAYHWVETPGHPLTVVIKAVKFYEIK